MTNRHHVFIINPAAGGRDRTTDLASEIAAVARAADISYDILITEYPRHACLLVREAAQAHPGDVLRYYACGGDGTLNEVAASAVRVPGASFTHYPTGSGNDFIKIFGPENVARFRDLSALIDGEILELDYIESECGNAVNILSVGVDARIARDMQKYKRIPGLKGTGSYLASTVENLVRGLHAPYKVEIDGQMLDGRYTLIAAANGRCYGSSFVPVPDADPQDGLLDILLVRDISRLKAASVLGHYKKGFYRDLPHVITHHKAREMTVLSVGEKPMTINLDGEIEQTLRIKLRVARYKMHFAVPRGVKVAPPEIRYGEV